MARTKKKTTTDEVVITPMEEVKVETAGVCIEEGENQETNEGEIKETKVESEEEKEIVGVNSLGDGAPEKVFSNGSHEELKDGETIPFTDTTYNEVEIFYTPGITSVDYHYVEQALNKAGSPFEAININDFRDRALATGVRTKFAVVIKGEIITNYRTALAKLKEYGKI